MNSLLGWIKKTSQNIDWILILILAPILFFGLVTMFSFENENLFFERQLIWIVISFVVFFIISGLDLKFLRNTRAVIWLYFVAVAILLGLFAVGSVYKGAQSWLNFGLFSFQPAELAKLVLILVLAKYFSRRHVEIRNIRHIIVSGAYAFIIFLLVLAQPDFGSAIILFSLWLGMVLVSGISKTHLFFVIAVATFSFLFLWYFVFADYQKARIMTFIHPLQDIQGTGYNSNQSLIAIGSGQILGKGVGYGTQSRLKFLPEYETDFIFAAFAEEWGYIGVLILFILYFMLIWRIIKISAKGATNFEVLYGTGFSIFLIAHFIIHVGMNIGVLPVTGLTLTFMSYGGTNILIAFIGLGILMSLRKNSRAIHRDFQQNEMVGV